jgi:hypothetical protein
MRRATPRLLGQLGLEIGLEIGQESGLEHGLQPGMETPTGDDSEAEATHSRLTRGSLDAHSKRLTPRLTRDAPPLESEQPSSAPSTSPRKGEGASRPASESRRSSPPARRSRRLSPTSSRPSWLGEASAEEADERRRVLLRRGLRSWVGAWTRMIRSKCQAWRAAQVCQP